jgi:hypothetical protein
MARQYREPIVVVLWPDGEPRGIVWRGAAYSVVEVLARWHLRDRWWAQPHATASRASGPATTSPLRDARDARADREAWDDPGAWEGWDTPRSGTSASDRYFYRLRCGGGLLCDVYRDATTNAWMLDRVWD